MAWGFVAAAVVGAVATSILAPKQQALPAPQAPPPLPQESKTPDIQGVSDGLKGQGQAGGAPGIAQTMLTGPGGVDPATLTLNKNTLIGNKTMLG